MQFFGRLELCGGSVYALWLSSRLALYGSSRPSVVPLRFPASEAILRRSISASG